MDSDNIKKIKYNLKLLGLYDEREDPNDDHEDPKIKIEQLSGEITKFKFEKESQEGFLTYTEEGGENVNAGEITQYYNVTFPREKGLAYCIEILFPDANAVELTDLQKDTLQAFLEADLGKTISLTYSTHFLCRIDNEEFKIIASRKNHDYTNIFKIMLKEGVDLFFYRHNPNKVTPPHMTVKKSTGARPGPINFNNDDINDDIVEMNGHCVGFDNPKIKIITPTVDTPVLSPETPLPSTPTEGSPIKSSVFNFNHPYTPNTTPETPVITTPETPVITTPATPATTTTPATTAQNTEKIKAFGKILRTSFRLLSRTINSSFSLELIKILINKIKSEFELIKSIIEGNNVEEILDKDLNKLETDIEQSVEPNDFTIHSYYIILYFIIAKIICKMLDLGYVNEMDGEVIPRYFKEGKGGSISKKRRNRKNKKTKKNKKFKKNRKTRKNKKRKNRRTKRKN